MINEAMKKLGVSRSTIRELFEYGRRLKEERGEENVFDYSLGNPNIPAHESVNSGIKNLISELSDCELHGYTSAEGDIDARKAISDDLFRRFAFESSYENVYMTSGAAGALVSTLCGITSKSETVIVLSPYFPEYEVFVNQSGANFKAVPCKNGSFKPDIEALEAAIDSSVAALIINSPNNPTGAVYSEDDIKAISSLLTKKSLEFGKPIYIISDEPYRELVYDGIKAPFIPNFYDDTIVCYSFSKSLSIPGERIGYVLVSPKARDSYLVMRAVVGAGRSLGYVCAPSLLQKLIPHCVSHTSDLKIYEENRNILYNALTSYGFESVYPSGAFYLFLKSPIESSVDFSEAAKKYGLLLVPGDDFGCKGYVRIAYCQKKDMILRSLPYFEMLAKEFGTTRG